MCDFWGEIGIRKVKGGLLSWISYATVLLRDYSRPLRHAKEMPLPAPTSTDGLGLSGASIRFEVP